MNLKTYRDPSGIGYEGETNHLLLRRPTKKDEQILIDLWRNEKVRRFLGGVVSDELIDGKFSSIQEHWDKYQFGQWAVCDKILNQIIGICGLHHSDDGVEISYMFFPEFWGKGRGTEAAIASLEYGFTILNCDQIIAITQEVNISSCNLLSNIGMHHINNLLRFNAVQRLYEMTKNNWFELRKG